MHARALSRPARSGFLLLSICLARPSPAGPDCSHPLFGNLEFGAGNEPYSVAVGDLDGDSDLDLAVANVYGANVSVLLNNGNGTFAADVLYGAGSYPSSVAVGDVDGDSDLDLAVANSESHNVSVLLNNGNGTFAAAVHYGAGGFSVAVGDLDGDSDLDLAVANGQSGDSVL
jgi:ankyrin repeat protein